MSMFKACILCTVLFTMVAIPLTAATSPAPSAAQGNEAFDEAMETASSALRSLRRSKFKPDAQADNFKAVQKLQMALLVAKENMDSIEMSPNAKAKFGSDLAAYRAAFRTDLINALMGSLQLELAIIAKDPEKANEHYRKLGGIRNASHELFENPE